MVGRVCHSSFKATAMEVNFAYEPFGWPILGMNQALASPLPALTLRLAGEY